MPRQWVGHWAGGRIQKKGRRKVFVIERMVQGERHTIPLAVDGEHAAERELDKFEADPVGYTRKRDEERSANEAVVDDDTILLYLAHMKAEQLSLTYRQDASAYLAGWRDWFAGRPIRAVSAAQIVSELDKGKAARHRLITLKAFCAWLRKVRHVLRQGDDPTMDIPIRAPVAEKDVRTKHYEIPHVEQIYRHIRAQDVRDVTVLRCKSGMHQTEASRIAEGKADLRSVETGTEIVGVVAFHHKSKATHYQSLDAQAFAAALRLAARRQVKDGKDVPIPIDKRRQSRELARAAKLATAEARKVNPKAKEIPPIKPGALRHSFITWRSVSRKVFPQKMEGIDIDSMAKIVGHKSSRTTRRFYDANYVPEMAVVPIHLHHPDDPPIPAGGAPPPKEVPAAVPAVVTPLP